MVLLFYKTEVLSEEVILKWYKDGHVPKGWTVFIDWLEQAESGKWHNLMLIPFIMLVIRASMLSPSYC